MIKTRGIPVTQYDLDGKYIKTFRSASIASQETNIYLAGISRSALGRRRTSGGFIWRYNNTDYSFSDVVYCQCCGKTADAETMVNISADCLRKLKEYN